MIRPASAAIRPGGWRRPRGVAVAVLLVLMVSVLVVVAMVVPVAAQALAPDQVAARGAESRRTEPFRIVMVTWRGWTDTDQGFKDYFETHRIPVDLIVRDAGRERARLPEIVQEIKAIQPDLVYTWGTSVSLGILGPHDAADPDRYVTDIPAVFANVSYPVDSKLVPSLAGSGRNIAGSTYLVPLETQLRAIRSYRPFDRLGIIYNAKETNSQQVAATLRQMADDGGPFVLVERPVPPGPDGTPDPDSLPALVAEVLAEGADFLYIPPDSFLSRHKQVLTQAALAAGLPTFAAAEGTLGESKAMMGLVSRYYNIGKLTAHLASRILLEGQDPGRMAVASLARYSLVLNMDVIRTLKFYPPIGLLRISEIQDSQDSQDEGRMGQEVEPESGSGSGSDPGSDPQTNSGDAERMPAAGQGAPDGRDRP